MHPELQPGIEQLFNLSVDMLCLAEIDGCFLTVNSSWTETLGWSLDELLQMNWRDLIHPEDEETIRSICRRLMSNDSADQCLVRCRKKNGTYKWTSWKAELHDADRICAVVRELDESPVNTLESTISHLQVMDYKHRESLKELEALVYTVSHDVRAPIRQISQFADLTADALSDNSVDEARYFVSRINKISSKASQLLVDLLWFSQASNTPLDESICNITRLAGETFEEISSRYPDRKFEFHADERMSATGDWRLLRILFTNLISNACKFTAENAVSKISVKMNKGDGRTVFSVSDNGVGFESAKAQDLFTPFVRAHSNEQFEGTGIGLATARRVVQRHGGEIWARSGEEEGAVFSFTLADDAISCE